jgi:hypothetical protein
MSTKELTKNNNNIVVWTIMIVVAGRRISKSTTKQNDVKVSNFRYCKEKIDK